MAVDKKVEIKLREWRNSLELAKLKRAQIAGELLAGSISFSIQQVHQKKRELEEWNKKQAQAERQLKAWEDKR